MSHSPLLSCLSVALLASVAINVGAQTGTMPDPDKADDQAKRLADSPFRRILEAGRMEVKLRRESDSLAPAPAAPAPKRAAAAPPPSSTKSAAIRAVPAPTPTPTPAPAPIAEPPVTVAAAALTAAVPQVERVWASFNGMTASVEGGRLEGMVYSEKPGDAGLRDITVRDDGVLNVTGNFISKGGSHWAGVGIVLTAERALVATDYKALKVRLASSTVGKLRVRLVGDDSAVQQAGCYPVVMVQVKPQINEYRIDLDRFTPQPYCGKDGVDWKTTLQSLIAIEVADTPEPVSERGVSFNVGGLSLIK